MKSDGIGNADKASTHTPSLQDCNDPTGAKRDSQPGIVRGGADCALDMENERDRGMVRKAIKRWPKRWRGVNDAKKDRIVDLTMKAAEKAGTLVESDAADVALQAIAAVGSCARTIVMIEGQTQADEHREDQNDRLDTGKITENVVLRMEHDRGG